MSLYYRLCSKKDFHCLNSSLHRWCRPSLSPLHPRCRLSLYRLWVMALSSLASYEIRVAIFLCTSEEFLRFLEYCINSEALYVPRRHDCHSLSRQSTELCRHVKLDLFFYTQLVHSSASLVIAIDVI